MKNLQYFKIHSSMTFLFAYLNFFNLRQTLKDSFLFCFTPQMLPETPGWPKRAATYSMQVSPEWVVRAQSCCPSLLPSRACIIRKLQTQDMELRLEPRHSDVGNLTTMLNVHANTNSRQDQSIVLYRQTKSMLLILHSVLPCRGTVTCSSSFAEPLFSTSISRQRFRKSRKMADSFSGF